MQLKSHRGVLGAVVLAVAVALVLLLAGVFDSGGGLKTAAAGRFEFRYPSSWRALSTTELAAIADHPAAGVVKQRSGLLLVRVKSGLSEPLGSIAQRLGPELSKRFPDFRPGTSGIVSTRAGRGFIYTFVRAATGLVQTVVIIPTARATYEIDVAEPARDRALADEVARMINSFTA